eukprot:Clim_evm30s119 gene=Clim_evmTU30s119
MEKNNPALSPRSEKRKRVIVPWTRTVQTGVELLRNPKYNKGMAFTESERKALRLKGLLPAAIADQDTQVQRALGMIRIKGTDLEKYIYLVGLQDRNEKLFYKVLVENVEEMMPLVYTPTVGQACLTYGHIFRRPRGLFISIKDKGHIFDILKNWPEKNIKAICVTDGERILGLGDLGAFGMGIPVGKLALYTALAGVRPETCLPITLDVGTNNEKLLNDPMYIGERMKRDNSQNYDDFIEEFVLAVTRRYGPETLIQWEDFGNHNAFRLLEKYKNRCCTFNDDIQGTASVALAGILSAVKLTGIEIPDHKFVFYGAGEAALGICSLICRDLEKYFDIPFEEAKKRVYLVDSRGLIVKGRSSGGITEHKAVFQQEGVPEMTDLAEIVRRIKPTALVGVAAQPQTFTEEICKEMAKNNKNPIIFALSNPTSKAECTAEQAYNWTEGRCVFASGSPFAPVEYNGKTFIPGQGNNAYIFPGVALGVLASKATRVTDDTMLIAARTLSTLVPEENFAKGCIYPYLSNIQNVSIEIATAVVEYNFKSGLSVYPDPKSHAGYRQMVLDEMYDFNYGVFDEY